MACRKVRKDLSAKSRASGKGRGSSCSLSEEDQQKAVEMIIELKEEIESVNEKVRELTPEELEQVTGGIRTLIPKELEQAKVGSASRGIVHVGAPVETLAIEDRAVVADPRKR